jgi:hypothetical protein
VKASGHRDALLGLRHRRQQLDLSLGLGPAHVHIVGQSLAPEAGVLKKLSLAGLAKLSRLRYSQRFGLASVLHLRCDKMVGKKHFTLYCLLATEEKKIEIYIIG